MFSSPPIIYMEYSGILFIERHSNGLANNAVNGGLLLVQYNINHELKSNLMDG